MNIAAYYVCIILAYIGLGLFGIFINLFKTDLVYFMFTVFLAISIIAIIVDVIESKKYKKKPFYKDVYKNKEFILVSFLNYFRLFLLTAAISFKNVGIVTATYLTFPVYVGIMSEEILKIKLKKKEIAGIVIAIIGIIIINFSGIKEIFTGSFNKTSILEIIYPLFSAIVFAYQLIVTKKYNKLTANNLILAQFIPVLPFTFFMCFIRNWGIIKKFYDFLLVPSLPFNFKHIIYSYIYGCIQFYLSYLVIFLFTKKYSPLLVSILSYISIFVSFIVRRYYFGKRVKYYQMGASLFVLAGIILIAYSEHNLRKNK